MGNKQSKKVVKENNNKAKKAGGDEFVRIPFDKQQDGKLALKKLNESQTVIDLSKLHFGKTELCGTIFEKIVQTSELKSLILKNCGLTNVVFAGFLKQASFSSLRHLDISGNNLNGEICADLGLFCGKIEISELVLKNNPFGKDIGLVFRELRKSSLEILDISNCGLNEESIQSLIELLRDSKINHLNLFWNPNISKALKSLFEALIECKSALKTFNIGGCGFDESVAKELLDYINDILSEGIELLLAYSAISPNTTVDIVKKLKPKSTLDVRNTLTTTKDIPENDVVSVLVSETVNWPIAEPQQSQNDEEKAIPEEKKEQTEEVAESETNASKEKANEEKAANVGHKEENPKESEPKTNEKREHHTHRKKENEKSKKSHHNKSEKKHSNANGCEEKSE